MSSFAYQDEDRVLVVAPTARDAQLSQALFAKAGLACAVCQDLAMLGAELARGAAVIVLTEEALAPERRQFLVAALAAQPTWSNLPLVMLASTGPRQLLNAPLVQQLGNVLVLERPISGQTLLSVVQMALRTRHRQYQARLISETGRLLTASLGDDQTLAAVAALLVPRLADCCIIATIAEGTPRVAALLCVPTAQPEGGQADCYQGAMPLAPGPEVEAPHAGAGANASTDLVEAHLRRIGASERLVVPLEAQGLLLGALGLGMLVSNRAFMPDNRLVVQEVAGRVALALNQARLYRAEQAARAEAEAAVRSRDELMALVSHDLNNPLTTILGQAQLLQQQQTRGTLMPERALRGFATIARAARQMQAQIAELMDTARLQAGRPLEVRREQINLVALTHAVVAAMQHGSERHQITVQTGLAALPALVDPVYIERMLDNLLSNALKYSPAGGPITVTIDREDEGAAAWAVVQVRDQGIGIPAADLPHVFERFRRASNVTPAMRGTGLGLASVRQIVEQHDGQITVTSPPEGGAHFTVRLPLGPTTE